MSVFEFKFISDDEVILHQHYQTTTMLATQAALGPYGSVIFLGCQDGEDGDDGDDSDNSDDLDEACPLLLVVDFIQGHEVLIHTRDMPEVCASISIAWEDFTKLFPGDLDIFFVRPSGDRRW